nr:hypothetical protein L204_01468 [Cryptococcus depauperatus CBS 7855]
MPLEVSPAPFAASQRLPFTPAIPRPDAGSVRSGSLPIGPGPVAAAATAIIQPTPGAIAGPDRAIPALPDAGYTSGHINAPASLYAYSYGGPRSISEFDAPYAPHLHHAPLSAIQSQHWAPSSLPAPRSRALLPSEPGTAPLRHHHHRRHARAESEDDDASYYAKPKTRARSRSGSMSSVSDQEGKERARPIGHGHPPRHQRSPSLPPGSGRGLHSPILPSPLATGGPGRSPLGVSDSVPVKKPVRIAAEARPYEYRRGDDRRAEEGRRRDSPPVSHLSPDYEPSPSATASLGGYEGMAGQRRRAYSMQGMERTPYQAHGYEDAFDDGASLRSGSRLEDGSVTGRRSLYGLPKYPHQPKADYRRFCVQRGNADVFLD